jgi:hypothetical protein
MCRTCGQERAFVDTTPGPLAAAFFALISFGLYLIPLTLVLLFPDKRNLRCPACGELQDMRGNVLGNEDSD